MIFNLVYQLSTNELHLGRATPYNIDFLFRKEVKVSIQDKKQFCVLLDLVRSLIVRSKIRAVQQGIMVYGMLYTDFDEEQFFDFLKMKMATEEDYLKFIYGKIGDVSKLKTSLNHLDQEKLTELYGSKK